MNERFYKGFETNDTRPEAILIEQFLSLHKPLELAIRWGGRVTPMESTVTCINQLQNMSVACTIWLDSFLSETTPYLQDSIETVSEK